MAKINFQIIPCLTRPSKYIPLLVSFFVNKNLHVQLVNTERKGRNIVTRYTENILYRDYCFMNVVRCF